VSPSVSPSISPSIVDIEDFYFIGFGDTADVNLGEVIDENINGDITTEDITGDYL
jgi:hypothetical protein